MKTLIILTFIIVTVSAGQAQIVELVKDINPFNDGTHLGGEPRILDEVNGRLLIQATDGVHGYSLWTSDGTAVGTQPLPGTALPLGRISLKVSDTLYFFSASTKSKGWDLYRTNATGAGTMLLDIRPGAVSSFPIEPQKLGNRMFFFCDDGVHGMEPWITDGTMSGTALVKDINPGLQGCARARNDVLVNGDTSYNWDVASFAFGNKIFFSLIDDAGQRTFWVSDGTGAGTKLLANNVSIDRNNDYSTINGIGNRCYFYSFDTIEGNQMWSTDGTPSGTVKLTSVKSVPPKNDTYFGKGIVANGKFYFDLIDSLQGSDLWVTDGTVAGTSLVKDPYLGGRYGNSLELVLVNHSLYFLAFDGTRRGLFKTDGTPAGTVQIGAFDGDAALTNINDYLIVLQSNVDTMRLWRLDTCNTLPQLYKSFIANGAGGYDFIGRKQNRLYFYADNGYSSGIWVTDGTATGTFECSVPNVTSSDPFFYYYYNTFPTIEYKSAFYYTAAYSDSIGYELYRVRDTTSVMSVTPCSRASVAPIANAQGNFKLYPNPAGDKIFWKSREPIDMIRITDLGGMMVLETPARSDRAIDISSLIPGTYFIRANSKAGRQVESKFVKR